MTTSITGTGEDETDLADNDTPPACCDAEDLRRERFELLRGVVTALAFASVDQEIRDRRSLRATPK